MNHAFNHYGLIFLDPNHGISGGYHQRSQHIRSPLYCGDYPWFLGEKKYVLVGGWTNPFEKYARHFNWIISPIFGVKIPKMFELPPHSVLFWCLPNKSSLQDSLLPPGPSHLSRCPSNVETCPSILALAKHSRDAIRGESKKSIWVLNTKNRGVYPPNHPILIGLSLIFTIHFGGFSPIFGSTPIYP